MAQQAETVNVESSTLALLQNAEIDRQIATARQYPRSVKQFRGECLDMVTLTEEIAQDCIYALPRDGKVIEGPSARFAEVIASAWGNCRAGARVVSEDDQFVTSQGVFHDLERNVAITYEVKRRITDKHGRRYKPDMIGVTANAACSIALRNAVLKGVPKAFWSDMYKAARQTVMGDSKTLANRRAEALKYLQGLGATPEMICGTLNVAGIEDIGLDELVVLRGIATAIKDGDTTVEQAFKQSPQTPKPSEQATAINERVKAQQQSPNKSRTNEPATPAAAKLPDVDELAQRMNQSGNLAELEALSNIVDEIPCGSKDRKTLVAVLMARKEALENQAAEEGES